VSRSLKAHILLVIITFIWGATFVVIKNALADMSPLLFNAVRMTLASAVLWVMFRKEMRQLTRDSVKAGAVVGIFLWLGYEFQTTGLKLTSASKSGFLTGLAVVLVPIFLAVFFRRRISRWTSFGVACASFGLYLLTVPATAAGTADWASMNLGDVLTLGCAVAFAFQIITIGRATQRHSFQQIATLQVAVCALLMILTVLFAANSSAPVQIEQSYAELTPRLVWALLITAIFATAVAFPVQAWAQQFLPPTHAALVFALEPVFAWVTSYVVLGERLGVRASIGAVLIMAGVLVSELMGSGPAELSELREETK